VGSASVAGAGSASSVQRRQAASAAMPSNPGSRRAMCTRRELLELAELRQPGAGDPRLRQAQLAQPELAPEHLEAGVAEARARAGERLERQLAHVQRAVVVEGRALPGDRLRSSSSGLS
jgi:hypothetical protein